MIEINTELIWSASYFSASNSYSAC